MSRSIARLIAVCLPFMPMACTFQPDLADYVPCAAGSRCIPGCTCMLGGVCVPDQHHLSPQCCSPDLPACPDCWSSVDCPAECQCLGGVCLPDDPTGEPCHKVTSDEPTCIPADLLVTGNGDQVDGGDAVMTLREALLRAAEPGTHHIRFAPEVAEIQLTGDLPPVPDGTYLEGAGVLLLPAVPGTPAVGLLIQGTGSVVSGLRLAGFTDAAVRIDSVAQDVHLFGMRIGDPDLPPNGNGIELLQGATDIVIGRGRELACIEPMVLLASAAPQIDSYDVNAIVANAGSGIEANGATGLTISGTWIGFDNTDDYMGRMEYANQGVGIHLVEVTNARIGADQLLDSENLTGPDDPLPAFVWSGRNWQGGLWIDGGGDIRISGLGLGVTPDAEIFDTNATFNLRIENTTGPVWVGPEAAASGQAANLFVMSLAMNNPNVEVFNTGDLVWFRAAQIFSMSGETSDLGVDIDGPAATVAFVHTTLNGDWNQAAIRFAYPVQAGYLLVMNSFFERWSSGLDVPVLEATPGAAQDIHLDHNMMYEFDSWCQGDCPDIATSNVVSSDDLMCDKDGAYRSPRPYYPDCDLVDQAEPVRWDGQDLDQNGELDGLYNGCAPDVGAYECMSSECQISCL